MVDTQYRKGAPVSYIQIILLRDVEVVIRSSVNLVTQIQDPHWYQVNKDAAINPPC